jgi:hypothetical protein
MNEGPWMETVKRIGDSGHHLVGLVCVHGDNADDARPEDFHRIGTLVRMHHPMRSDGKIQFIAEGITRFEVAEWIPGTAPYYARRISVPLRLRLPPGRGAGGFRRGWECHGGRHRHGRDRGRRDCRRPHDGRGAETRASLAIPREVDRDAGPVVALVGFPYLIRAVHDEVEHVQAGPQHDPLGLHVGGAHGQGLARARNGGRAAHPPGRGVGGARRRAGVVDAAPYFHFAAAGAARGRIAVVKGEHAAPGGRTATDVEPGRRHEIGLPIPR